MRGDRNKYCKLFLYTTGIKKSEQRLFYEKMVNANDIEKETLLKLCIKLDNDTKQTVHIANDFNKKYTTKHKKDYLAHYKGETLYHEAEHYNRQKAFIFDRYIRRWYLK